MNEQPSAPKVLSSPVRQIGVLASVVVLGVLAKQIISATIRWRVYVERFSWLGWTTTILGLTVLAVVAAGVAAVIGKKLNRPTAVLLGVVAGGLATAVAYHPVFGGAIGLVVGGIVAAGIGRKVAAAAGKTLTAMTFGALAGTIAFSFYESLQEIPIVTTAILTTAFFLVTVGLFTHLIRRILKQAGHAERVQSETQPRATIFPDMLSQELGAPGLIRAFVGRGIFLIVVVFGFWLGLSIDTCLRVRSVASGSSLREFGPTPVGVHWLWQGMLDVTWVSLREDVTDADVAKLQRFENLFTVIAKRCPHLTDRSLETIGRMPGIGLLDLNGVNITDDGLKHLSGMPALNYLILSDTKITGAGLVHAPPSLVELDLHGSSITDAGLENLPNWNRLRRLYLSHTQVTDGGLVHLLGRSSLDFISLDGTKISDAGLEELVCLQGLKSVILSGTAVTDDGLAYLVQLPKLEYLDLTNTQITDDGLAHLKKIPSLYFIGLTGTRVSDAGAKDLEKAWPGAHIETPSQRRTR